jgi:hypothetical protein
MVDIGDEALKGSRAGAVIKAPCGFVDQVRGLGESDVLSVGQLHERIVREWTEQTDGNLDVVLTGKQRGHYLARHPETVSLEALIRAAVLDPDEVHRNRYDPAMAIFYRRIGERRYVRVAVLMQVATGWRKHSILSYRRAKAEELARNKDRVVWRRG